MKAARRNVGIAGNPVIPGVALADVVIPRQRAVGDVFV